MVCSIYLSGNLGLIGILKVPLGCDYYFYGKIMLGLFIIFTLLLYIADRKRMIKADLLSCLGVSAIATILISIAGTLLEIITTDILVIIIVIGLIFISVWILKKDEY